MPRDKSYYSGLITSQYDDSTKFKAWLDVLMTVMDNTSQFMASIPAAFDVDTAIGVQLDTTGVYVGIGRTVTFQPSGGVSPVLDDETYRLVIKAKIAKNTWDGRLVSLYEIWRVLFPQGGIRIKDNQNMSMTVYLLGTFNSIITDLIIHGYLMPKPEGVRINYEYEGEQPYFGFDRDDDYISGFDAGHFI